MKSHIPQPTSRIPAFALALIVLVAIAGSGFNGTILETSGFSQPLSAQEGHPLAGTWHGTWGPNATERHDVTLVLDYDGKAIVGMMNPGPDAIHFDTFTLDPSTWSVHFEATPKGAAKTAPRIVIDTKIQDVTSRRRSLVGTWTQGATKGDFKATRDD
jgi:hypothetical protein